MILKISANTEILRTKPCVQQMLLKEQLLAQKKFILHLKKREKKKKNKEAFNWTSIFLTHFKAISHIHQQFLQEVRP